jgi:diguanylate cyclase (GGDEF)-like protein
MPGNYDETSKFATDSIFGNKLSQVRGTRGRATAQRPQATAAWQETLTGQAAAVPVVQPAAPRQSEDDIERLALYDSLTELYNHRTFMRWLTYELKRGMRYKRPVAICLVSIDALEQISRQFGDMTADFVRKEVAKELRGAVRDVDIPARYSAKEFAVMLPETNSNGATCAAERMKKRVGARVLNLGTQSIRVTVSIGIASFPTHGREPAELLGRAWQALELAVHRGGDRHCVV